MRTSKVAAQAKLNTQTLPHFERLGRLLVTKVGAHRVLKPGGSLVVLSTSAAPAG